MEFNIDEVFLDFYYGNHGIRGYPFQHIDEDAQPVCFALYFYDGQYAFNEGILPHRVDRFEYDYHDVESYYFLKTIAYDAFLSDDYRFNRSTVSFGNRKEFNHHEVLTVPKEVFERESGSFVFQIAEVWFSQTLNQYCLCVDNFIYVDYDLIDEQTIRLSRPTILFPQ